MAVPLITLPCSTSALLPPQELTTQQMVSKVLLYSGLNGERGLGRTEALFRRTSSDSTPGTPNPRNSHHPQGEPPVPEGAGIHPTVPWTPRHSQARETQPRCHLLSVGISSRFFLNKAPQNVEYTVPDAKEMTTQC